MRASAAIGGEEQEGGQCKDQRERRDDDECGGVAAIDTIDDERDNAHDERDGERAVWRYEVRTHGCWLSWRVGLELLARMWHRFSKAVTMPHAADGAAVLVSRISGARRGGDDDQDDEQHSGCEADIADDEARDSETTPLRIAIRLLDLMERDVTENDSNE